MSAPCAIVGGVYETWRGELIHVHDTQPGVRTLDGVKKDVLVKIVGTYQGQRGATARPYIDDWRGWKEFMDGGRMIGREPVPELAAAAGAK